MTILSKQYPMDLGTGSIEQVRQSAPKIDMELGAIYGHLNNIRTRYRSATAPTNPEAGQVWEDTVNNKIMKWNGSAWAQDIGVSINLTNRNTVLQGQVSSAGALELILGSTSTLTASLVSSAIETNIAIPAGHDATVGNLDYIVSFSATQTDFWTSLPANNTSHLFVDYSSGTVTGTYSVIAPVYQSYAPSHSAGLNWFDVNREQWYLSDGSNWVAKYRCYVGYVVTDGTKVTATTIEPYLKLRGNLSGNVTGDVTGNVTGAASLNVLKSTVTTAGDMLYATAASVLARLGIGTAGTKLFVNAAGNAPEWANGMFVGSFTRDVATASGNQSVSGVGFKPSMLVALCQIDGGTAISIGFGSRCVFNYLGSWYANNTLIDIAPSSGAFQTATIASYDADGFTLTWTKAGSPVGGATISYLAFR